MIIETKFELEQEVYPISQRSTYDWIECPTCQGKGNIVIQGSNEEMYCPKCYGKKGHSEYRAKEWAVCYDFASKIGKIDFEIYARKYEEDYKSTRRYMLRASGVGSGTCWDEDNLFASEEEAIAECQKRNADILCE